MGLIESCGNDYKDVSTYGDTKQDKLWQQKVMQEHKHQMTSLIKDKNINKQMQSIKEEHEQLTLMLNDLTQKLQQQISENQMLRKELTQTQMNSDNYEEELCDETLKNININIQQPQEEINETSQAEIDTHYEELHAIHIDEKNISENRVRATLTEAQLLPDVKTFIWNKYKTTNVYDDADHTQDMYDDNISVRSESSLDSKDKMEIAFVKRKTLEQEEIMYMQNELKKMQQDNQIAMNDKKESVTTNISNKYNYSDNELRISDDDGHLPALLVTSSNLFRYRSDSNWNEDELMKQKKEMTAQLAHMVVAHVKSFQIQTNNCKKDLKPKK